MQTLRPHRHRPSPAEHPHRPRAGAAARRSPCPVSCALDLLGDRWTLLVVRDLLMGRSRFKDFSASPERIPTNVLADRLARLTAEGMVEQRPVSPGARRLSYHLTEKGEALRPVLHALKDWGLAWEPGTEARLAGTH